ncbi:MAG: DUF1254 domain-containing protein [Saprospiraceae bacterium]|nr:DUF1254 domain-containing protein [Saprospiraceae bacterium]
MQKKRFYKAFVLLSLLLLSSCQGEETTITTPEGELTMNTDELLKTIGEIYAFGYPLILMDMTKRLSTNTERPHPTRPRAPVNQLGHFREFPDHTLTAVVKPNVDTYYSIAWLDLGQGPQVLSIPATERYYLLPFMDAYSNVFASPGTRTTGSEAQNFLVVGPEWSGETPAGLSLIQAPTEMVWMLGRIQVNSEEDGATSVRAIQDSMQLVPFSEYGKADYLAPRGIVDPDFQETTPVKAIRELDLNTYFNRLSDLMVQNPPALRDSGMVGKMQKLGLVPGKPFELNIDNLILRTKLKALPEYIHKRMEERRAQPDTSLLRNGWSIATEGIGEYGTDYLRRAFINFIALGANLPEDAVYPNLVFDINGEPLSGKRRYQIHFEANQLPPVNAFWSLTVYNADEFLVENEFNRYALGDRDALKYHEDGSLDLYIQAEGPAEADRVNWLPTPKEGQFFMTLRLYWPKAAVLDGDWLPPPVIPVKD